MATTEHRERPARDGRILGWISGLGIVAVPWIVSGIVSTFTSEPETWFPWVFFVAFVAMVGWIVYGIVHFPGFRRGSLIGSAIALGVVVVLLGLLILTAGG